MSGTTFSADDIIGKTLTAKQPVNIYRYDNWETPVYTVKAGQPVGVVFSYLAPNDTRPELLWMFYDANKKPYYAKHKAGAYSVKSLKEQGVLTEQEQAEANQSTGDKIIKLVQKGFLFAGLFYLGATFIRSNSKQ